MPKKGFYFWVGKHEYFIETAQQNITQRFCEKILHKLNQKVCPSNVVCLRRLLRKAYLEEKQTSDGKIYYNIYGDGFGGYGTDPYDGLTTILQI